MEQFAYWLERLRVFSLTMFYLIATHFSSLTGIAPLDKLIGFTAATFVFGVFIGLPLYILLFRSKR